MAAGIDREELRALVREALKESLATSAAAATPAADGLAGEIHVALGRGRPARLPVAVASSADLDRFAQALAGACGDDTVKAAIVAGDVRFELARTATPSSASTAKPAAPARGGAFEMSSGVLSEAKIVEISRTHRKILVGRDVVMTPLARDKAREMKVELVRQKP
jgi:hypothetical protein